MEMKKLLMIFVFGTLAVQNPSFGQDTSPVKADVKTVTVNADEFQRVKDLVFGLTLQNYNMANKKNAEPLDLAYDLILENNRLKADNVQMVTAANSMGTELKAAKTMIQVKEILKRYGL
jgi:hypothetical protein